MSATAPEAAGRRERKKAATRAAISDAALRLFLAHGYDQVSLRQIADEADVAVATVFKHFSGKEALVFDEDADVEAGLLRAIDERPPGASVLDSLERHVLGSPAVSGVREREFARFLELVVNTPALDAYWRQTWMRHADVLAARLREAAAEGSSRLSVAAATAVARVVLDAAHIARRDAHPEAAVADVFEVLRSGWPC